MELFIFAGIVIIAILILCLYSLNSSYESVRGKLSTLQSDYNKLTGNYDTLSQNYVSIKNKLSFYENLFHSSDSQLKATAYMAGIIADIESYGVTQLSEDIIKSRNRWERDNRIKVQEIREQSKQKIEQYKKYDYQLRYILTLYPQLEDLISGICSEEDFLAAPDLNESLKVSLEEKYKVKQAELEENLKRKGDEIIALYYKRENELEERYKKKEEKLIEDYSRKFDLHIKEFLRISGSNKIAIPYMARIIADIETYGIEKLALKLDWGSNQEREKKVKAIREIRKDAQEMIERHKWAQYQLEYLLELYPVLQDVIETEFNQLPIVEIKDVSELEEYDYARDYLSKEEYKQLTTTQRNQLALDRYVASHRKTKWQIGRDYELYCGYQYALKGYAIEYYGSFMGLEDLGRDLICKKKDAPTLIIQCKYWSQVKTIHEKHIMQLYGTMISYCIEHNLEENDVKGVLITNITLSDVAKQMAKRLNIETVESFPLKEYPRIKCNINTIAEGKTTKIYHLPFDQQYDSTKIDKEGEFFALTVADAEEAGFRRAFKHFIS